MSSESTHSMPLIIRADANSRIGTGHVMRCIALGQAWMAGRQRTDDGGRKSEVRSQGSGVRDQESEESIVVFMTCCDNAALLQRLRDEKFTVIELTDSAEFISTLSPDSCTLSLDSWFVLDGYQFTLEDQRAVREAGHKLLVIDDCNHLPEYECDILLNQNINAAELDYTINPEARLLLGTDYILLRREFFQSLEEFKQVFPKVGKTPEAGMNVLVTLKKGVSVRIHQFFAT
jgi:spore coat polysaccharide biosynthesis predicted glycosyltransferase SpsG